MNTFTANFEWVLIALAVGTIVLAIILSYCKGRRNINDEQEKHRIVVDTEDIPDYLYEIIFNEALASIQPYEFWDMAHELMQD